MSTADIIILLVVLIIVGLIIYRMIKQFIRKDYCADCSSKTGCALKIDDLLKEIDKDIQQKN